MRFTFIDLNPDESPYYPFMIYLDTCDESGDILDGLSTIIFNLYGLYVPNKAEDVNVKVLNISRINELKLLLRHISCDCRCRFTLKIVI